MDKIKIGVVGLGRGSNYFEEIEANSAELVAVCESNEKKLKENLAKLGDNVAGYTDFDKFIEHDMDAVFLANFFHEHTALAIRCLEKNIHVLSECTSNATMGEGVALVRAAEKSNAVYMLAENYPFMLHNVEIKKIYENGSLGKLLYAECEYNHPFDANDGETVLSIRPNVMHWRNFLPRTYYITHSLCPVMHITGARPVRVTALPCYAPNDEKYFVSPVGDRAAIISTLNDDDSVFRITGCSAFGAHGNYTRVCGTNGQVETVRGTDKLMLRYNSWHIPEGKEENNFYTPELNDADSEGIANSGHGGSDFIVMREFLNCIREKRQPVFDVYFATTAASVGILSHRSLLEKGVPYDIPDFRKEEDRQKWENDFLSPFPKADGTAPDLPCCSHPECKPSQAQLDAFKEISEEK